MTVPEANAIEALARQAASFREKLALTKKRLGPPEFQWYPYDTLRQFCCFDKLLTGDNRYLLKLARRDRVLDLGCGDADSAFFFESLGYPVDAVDYPPTNLNGMRGARALAKAMKSTVEIHERDLDSFFTFPHKRYGLALCLGLLYHLKNPYYLLENLARVSRYCLLSTRVARFAPDHRTRLHDIPVAYLVGEDETNNDSTNFWIFTEAGLRRIVERTRWKLCDYWSAGDAEGSDPANPERDERAYCLLHSPALDSQWHVELLSGWHPMEDGHFRWTERRFSVQLEAPSPQACSALSLEFVLPEEHFARVGPVTLRAAVNGVALPQQTYSYSGTHTYAQNLPAIVSPGSKLLFDFTLDRALPPTARDARELGLVVSFARGEHAVTEANLPLDVA
jgi:SAM-dependent methyltransferase